MRPVLCSRLLYTGSGGGRGVITSQGKLIRKDSAGFPEIRPEAVSLSVPVRYIFLALFFFLPRCHFLYLSICLTLGVCIDIKSDLCITERVDICIFIYILYNAAHVCNHMYSLLIVYIETYKTCISDHRSGIAYK